MDADEIFVIETNSSMIGAFERLRKDCQNKYVRLMSVEELFDIDIRPKEQLFVLDDFSGQEFRHLKELNARVFGPFGILQYLNQEQLPNIHHNRIANFAMDNLIVMFSTSVDPIIQAQLKELVLQMGGRTTNVLADATHLVVHKVSDPEVSDAKNLAKRMTKEWIRAVWAASGQRIVKATDEYFQIYACPPLYGLYISINSSSNELESLVLKNGGKLTDATEVQCSHLIVCDDQEVIKISDQLVQRLNIVSVKWIYECDKTQTYLDPNLYRHELVQVIKSLNGKDTNTADSSFKIKDRTADYEDPSDMQMYDLAHIEQEQFPTFFNHDDLKSFISQQPQQPIGVCVDPDDPLAEGFASFLKTDPMVKVMDKTYPFADGDMEENILRLVQEAKYRSQLEVGVKNATFSLRVNPLLIVLANDTVNNFKDLIKKSEEKKVPYIFVTSKYELGKAMGFERSIICCSILEKENSNLSQEFQQLLLDIQALNSP